MIQSTNTTRRSPAKAAAIASAVVGAAYLTSLLALMRRPDANLVEPLFLLFALGIVFPALAWALTRPRADGTFVRARPDLAPAGGPVWPTVLYLAMFAVAVLGWGFSALKTAIPDEPAQSTAQTLLKLATMVALPVWLLLRGQPRLRPRLGAGRLWLVFVAMSLAFLAFQAVFGRGLHTLGELSPSTTTLLWAIPLCLLWQTLEAGLCEEVLFRRILQQRLFDETGSQIAAIGWASLLFGLAHAPGLWMRGASAMEGVSDPTMAWAVAYSIVMIAPVGIAFGVLWARTRSLWLLVPLHGLVDLLPNLANFIRDWSKLL